MPWFSAPGQQNGGMWGGGFTGNNAGFMQPPQPWSNKMPPMLGGGGLLGGTLGQMGGVLGGLFGRGPQQNPWGQIAGGAIQAAQGLLPSGGQPYGGVGGKDFLAYTPETPIDQRFNTVGERDAAMRAIWAGFPQQPQGPVEAPEAHPGMADQQAGQWAGAGGLTPTATVPPGFNWADFQQRMNDPSNAHTTSMKPTAPGYTLSAMSPSLRETAQPYNTPQKLRGY